MMLYNIHYKFFKFKILLNLVKYYRVVFLNEELLKMMHGEITDEEMFMAKTKVISSLKSMEDSMYNTSNYLIALRVFGIPYTVESVISGIEKVTKERVVDVAKGIEFIAAHYLDGEV